MVQLRKISILKFDGNSILEVIVASVIILVAFLLFLSTLNILYDTKDNEQIKMIFKLTIDEEIIDLRNKNSTPNYIYSSNTQKNGNVKIENVQIFLNDKKSRPIWEYSKIDLLGHSKGETLYIH